MTLNIPELSLVLLVGMAGSGKSTFAKKHFKKTEIVSSDECRGIVSNDENSLTANKDAFDLLYYIIGKRLKNGLLTVVDATNIQPEARKGLIKLAKEYHILPVAIVLDIPSKICEERNAQRTERNIGNHVLRLQKQQLRQSLKKLKREGFRKIHILKSPEEVDAVTGIVREKLYNDKKEETGPFDIIGDIHGCFDELKILLEKMGYVINAVEENSTNFGFEVIPPDNRKLIFLGDLVDRGPKNPEVLKLVMSTVNAGNALCVPGNHDIKLQKWLKGKQVQINHGLEETIAQLESYDDAFKNEVKEFIYSLVSHYILDNGKLVVSHAGLKEEMQGRASGVIRSFCLYGETTGEIDEFGLPVRYNWASEYRGKAKVIYGHTPIPQPEWLNRTLNIDTGCVFGGALTALRYPEETLVSIPAQKVYCEPAKSFEIKKEKRLSHQQEYDDLLNIEDVIGKRIIQTRLRNNITIREDNSIAALEVMSRFAIHPKWLIYLPPTMSPCGTSELEDYLEHPLQALNYYKKHGVEKVICEEKHMGSRAVVIVAKDEATIQKRFGLEKAGIGKCYTRTGRNFFNDEELEKTFLNKVKDELSNSGFWKKFETDWVCLDCELMPWSAKAMALLKEQYAALGCAAKHALPHANEVLQQTQARNIEGLEEVLAKFEYKEKVIAQYTDAYRQYCWTVDAIEDYKLAPFHILATEGSVYTDQTHEWHMENIREIADANKGLIMATPYKIIEVRKSENVKEAVDWWMELTAKGGEGMVVKPLDFLAYEKSSLLQPAVKCRGKEYLRIIYGPEYDLPENLKRLKNRGLSRKRSLAIREFALGVEGLERFVQQQPLRRVHESVFGVLALESEGVDPRL